MWEWEGTLLDPFVKGEFGSALSSKILYFEKTYFVDCLVLKFIFITKRCPNDRTHGMQCMVVDGGRVIIRSKSFIDSEMIWARGVQPLPPDSSSTEHVFQSQRLKSFRFSHIRCVCVDLQSAVIDLLFSVFDSVCLFVCLSVCLSVCLYVCMPAETEKNATSFSPLARIGWSLALSIRISTKMLVFYFWFTPISPKFP